MHENYKSNFTLHKIKLFKLKYSCMGSSSVEGLMVYNDMSRITYAIWRERLSNQR